MYFIFYVEDIQAFLDNKIPESQGQKCFSTCMLEKFNIIHENRFSKEGYVGFYYMIHDDDEEIMDKARTVALICDNVGDDEDHCEAGAKVFECVTVAEKEHNLK